MDNLRQDLKSFIIETLQIPDVTAEQIGDSDPLFEHELLNLDSLDAAELAVRLHQVYGLRISDQNLAREVLQSVDTMAQAILALREEAAASGA